MRDLIGEKTGERNLKFGDLIVPQQEGDPDEDYEKKYKYKLQVIVSDISASRMLILPRDADLIGLDPDKLEVALALRMSGSFPFFFKPVY